ncbi:hypothetical protein SBA3_3140009 [Candidatus Sulfopaludibacter sp. SbA3]|nr:hypothetical protein SBA3_3140009 [Candidatus Sulfopaludibacter sp. SbA3]
MGGGVPDGIGASRPGDVCGFPGAGRQRHGHLGRASRFHHHKRAGRSFGDLADGAWQIAVEMPCSQMVRREVAVAAGAPAALWELRILPAGEFHTQQAIAAAPPPPAHGDPPKKSPTAPSRRWCRSRHSATIAVSRPACTTAQSG